MPRLTKQHFEWLATEIAELINPKDIDKISVNNAGNDCIDLSSGKYKILSALLNNCGDKAISVGEKTITKIKHVETRKIKKY